MPGPAQAGVAEQLAGLLMQGCLPFAGDAAALRAWAGRASLPVVPEPARGVFLHGAPGTVFDASNQQGKFVLVSADDGLCSVVTDTAASASVAPALEDDLRHAGIAFRLAIERDDKRAGALHYREYLATRTVAAGNRRSWRILAATVSDQPVGEAMLTAGPE